MMKRRMVGLAEPRPNLRAEIAELSAYPISMQPTKEILDDIYLERVQRARRTAGGEKLLGGARLFDEVVERMIAGIRLREPKADDARVQRILAAQLAHLRKLDEMRARGELADPFEEVSSDARG